MARAKSGAAPVERWAWPLAGAALAFLALLVALADLGRLPGMLQAVYAFPGGDKVGHVFVAALVALPLSLALRGQTVYLGRCSLPLAALLAGAMLTMEELSQMDRVQPNDNRTEAERITQMIIVPGGLELKRS